MSTDKDTAKAIGEALDRLIPTALDNVITLNRSHAELRIATAADLEPLGAKVPYGAAAQDISRWSFVTLHWHPKGPPGQIITALFGYNESKRSDWNTSPVEEYDKRTGCARTRSGTLYRVVGDSSPEPDLLRVCAWVHSAHVGEHLGVMYIFY